MSNQFVVKKGLIVQSGDANVSSSLFVERNVVAKSFTGSIQGTSSWATNVVNDRMVSTGSSYPITSSWAVYWNSASVVSLINTKQNNIATGSTVPFTSSWATNVVNQKWLSTGSTYPITSSWAISASYAPGGSSGTTLGTGSSYPITSSWAENAKTASYITGSIDFNTNITYLLTASWATNVVGGGSGASLTTGSTYPITSSWAISSSWATNAVVAQNATSANTASHVFASSGDWSNRIRHDQLYMYSNILDPYVINLNMAGDSSIFTEHNIGLATVPSNFKVETGGDIGPDTDSAYDLGSSTYRWKQIYTNGITGSLFGTSSWAGWATNVVNQKWLSTGSSYPITSSWAVSASWAPGGGTTLGTGSTYPITSSWAENAKTASYITGSIDFNSGITYPLTASWATNVVGGSGAGLSTGSTYPITSSWAVSASYAAGAMPTFTGMTDNYFPKWSSNTLTGTSLLYEDANGIAVGNASSIGQRLLVSGSSNSNGGVSITSPGITTLRLYTTGSPTSTGVIGRGENGQAILIDVSNNVTINNLTGSLRGTSSWATNVVNDNNTWLATGSSYPITSSWAVTARTASLAPNYQLKLTSGSLVPVTSSWATNVVNDRMVSTGSTYPITSSWAISASYAAGAAPTFTGKTDNYIPKWASNTLTGTSNIYDDGSNIAIGTNNPLGIQLLINGSATPNGGIAVLSSSITSMRMYVTGSPSNTGVIGRFTSPAILINSDNIVTIVNDIIINGEITASSGISVTGNSTYTGDIFPSLSSTFDLGSGVYYWDNAFVNKITSFQVSSSTGINTPMINATRITGSLYGTSSWATNVVGGAGGTTLGTGSSYPITSSWAENAKTASYITGSIDFNNSVVYPLTASWAANATPSFTGKTDNYIPKWSSNTLTGTSLLIDNGSAVGLNVASPFTLLHIDQGIVVSGQHSQGIRLRNTGSAESWILSSGIIGDDKSFGIKRVADNSFPLSISASKGVTVSNLTSSAGVNVSGNSIFNGDITPAISSIYDLGSGVYYWDNAFINNIVSTKITGSLLGTASYAAGGKVTITTNTDNNNYRITLASGTSGNQSLLIDGGSTPELAYNPSTQILSVANISSGPINAINITGSTAISSSNLIGTRITGSNEYIMGKIGIGTAVIPTYACNISASAGGTGSLSIEGDFRYITAVAPVTRALVTLDDYMIPIVTSGSNGMQTYYLALYRKV